MKNFGDQAIIGLKRFWGSKTIEKYRNILQPFKRRHPRNIRVIFFKCVRFKKKSGNPDHQFTGLKVQQNNI